jgi:hypothetical protein
MTPEERQEIRERHVATDGLSSTGRSHCAADFQWWPCDTARLLADYDHLVEMARDVQSKREALTEPSADSMIRPRAEAFADALDALRALIDPATPDTRGEAKCSCGRDIFRPWINGIQEPWKHWVEPLDHPATPEPVEGEPTA